ncbi:hypothetical protein BH09GEM1_BH09GEM1_11790 [soil metagenome]
MMRCLLFSDVHANYPALGAVLRDVGTKGNFAGRYHLGDLVGYALWPDEVIRRIAQEAIPGVAGNYDSTVATAYKHCGCRYEDAKQEALSHESYAWTLANTSDASTSVAVEFIRVEYDVDEAARGIIESTLPNDSAEYLRAGGKPSPMSGI